MKKAFGVLVVLLMTGSFAWAQSGTQTGPMTPSTGGQMGSQAAPPMAPPTGAQPGPPTQGTAPSEARTSQDKEVQGTIASVDQSGQSITLDNGTQLMIPDSLKDARSFLKEGARVKATYEEQAGKNIATSLQVESKS
jgi:hypothetical protein